MISPDKIEIIENRQYIHYEGHNVGLIPACQILELGDFSSQSEMYSILVLKDQAQYYGIVVDRFTEEKELVVQELQHLIGKIPNISAGSLTEDGNPLLIIDVEEMIRSVDLFLSGAHLQKL
jgi:two-component system sensor histidine kinase and response regulator WspE